MSSMEVPSKEYEIKTLKSLRNILGTPNRTVDISDPVGEQASENGSFDFNQFDYERYLDSEVHLERRFKQMTLKKPETNQKPEETPVDSTMFATKLVKQR